MSRPRAHSEAKQPHAVGLKVLRLTSPHFALQYPVPHVATASPTPSAFDTRAGLAYTPAKGASGTTLDAANPYILSPVLTLPPAFGPAYVGETFACTLVASDEPAHNQIPPAADTSGETIEVENVKISAEMQTPSAKEEPIPLDAYAAPATPDSETDDDEGDDDDDDDADKKPKLTQRIVRHALLEEGTHVLAVTVTYNESRRSQAGGIVGNRVRTFRKLYQFAAKSLLVVSVKTRRYTTGQNGSYVLEAQLENVADASIVLDDASVIAKDGLSVESLNTWGHDIGQGPTLGQGDVQQVCFLIRPGDEELEETADGAEVLGRLDVRWRNAMGERGRLATGWLHCKK